MLIVFVVLNLLTYIHFQTVSAQSLPGQIQYNVYEQFGYVSNDEKWIKYSIDGNQCIFKYSYRLNVDSLNLNNHFSFLLEYKYDKVNRADVEQLKIIIDDQETPFNQLLSDGGFLWYKHRVQVSFQTFISKKFTTLEIYLLTNSISTCSSTQQKKLDYTQGYLSSLNINRVVNLLCPGYTAYQDRYQCIICDQSYNRVIHNQYCICQDGFYQSESQLICPRCTPSCLTCEFNQNKCTACFENAYLDYYNRCICQDGFFMNADKRCQKCSPLCKKCQFEEQRCMVCIDEVNMVIPVCQCPYGMFYSHRDLQCQYCNENCASCSDSANQCIVCTSGYIMAPKCILQCTITEEYNEILNKCVPLVCNNKCEFCIQDKDNCTTCKGDRKDPPFCVCDQFKYDDFKSENCLSCPEGEYMDQFVEPWTCKKCHYSCKKCSGQRISECIDCYSEQFSLSGEGQCECIEKLDSVYDNLLSKPKCVQLMQMALSVHINELFQQVFRITFTKRLLDRVTKQSLSDNFLVRLQRVQEDAFQILYQDFNYEYIEFVIVSKQIIPIQKVSVYVKNQFEIVGEENTLISRWYCEDPVEIDMLQDLQDLSSKQENLLKLKQASESVQNNSFVKFVTTYYFFLFILSTLQPTILFLLISTQLPITLELFLKIIGQFVFNKNKFFAWYQLSLANNKENEYQYHIFLSDVTDDIKQFKPPIYEIEQLGFMENFLYNTQVPILIISLLSLIYWIAFLLDKLQFTEFYKSQTLLSNEQKIMINKLKGKPKEKDSIKERNGNVQKINAKEQIYSININGIQVNTFNKDYFKAKNSSTKHSSNKLNCSIRNEEYLTKTPPTEDNTYSFINYKNNSPLTNNNSPLLNGNNSSFTTNNSPLIVDNAPFKDNSNTHLKDINNASCKDDVTPIKENNTPFKENNTPFKENKTPFKENNTHFKENSIPFKDNQSNYNDNNNSSPQNENKLKKIQQFVQNKIVSSMESNFAIFFISMGLQFNNIQSSNVVNRISVYLCFFFLSQFIYFHVRCFYLMRRGKVEEIPLFTDSLKRDKQNKSKYYFHFYSLCGKIMTIICIMLNRYNQIFFISIITAVQFILLAYIIRLKPFQSRLFLALKIIGTATYFLSWFCLLLLQIKKTQLKSEDIEFYSEQDMEYLNNLGLALAVFLCIFNGVYLIYTIVQAIRILLNYIKSIFVKQEINLIIPYATYSKNLANIELATQNHIQDRLIQNDRCLTQEGTAEVKHTPQKINIISHKVISNSSQNVSNYLIKFQSTSYLGIPIHFNKPK